MSSGRLQAMVGGYRQEEEGGRQRSLATGSGKEAMTIEGDQPTQKGEGQRSPRYSSSHPYIERAPPKEELQLRQDLRYQFMTTYEKYHSRGQKPWNLSVQIVKIIIFTIQLSLFGANQFAVVQFMEDNTMSFRHIFLKGWDSTYDSEVYPSTKHLYALYTNAEFYQHINNVIHQYSNMRQVALGTYVLPPSKDRRLCVHIEEYTTLDIYSNDSFNVDLDVIESTLCMNITHSMPDFHFHQFLEERNHSISFDTLKWLELGFDIASINVRDLSYLTKLIESDCTIFNVKITYDNVPHSGCVRVRLSQEHHVDDECTKRINQNSKGSGLKSMAVKIGIVMLDTLVIILCLISFILSTRSLYIRYHLCKKTYHFFDRYYSKKLSWSEIGEFINLWFLTIILSDVLTLTGTTAKILIQEQKWTNYDAVSVLLGLGCFLVWFGILRYLTFFHSYSIPVITLKCAMPNMLKFLICSVIMFLAYGFCGWVVLGPYHAKFRTFSITVECMFSLLNGDDMFATYRAISGADQWLKIFCQIYLYSFISLFIYVVLSLFIAVIMDTYETVKAAREKGEYDNDLQRFYMQADGDSFGATHKLGNIQTDEYTPLVD